MNLDERVVKWFESYLTDRKQRVLANTTFSTFLNVMQGIPQGSVLGPLFHIIYANDISKVIKHCKIALYVDDMVLYMGNADFGKTAVNMQNDINALSEWCIANGIQMNVEKKTR